MASSLKRKLKNKKAPEGWNLIEEVIEDFEQQLKDAVAEESDGKRKCEASWKIHRIHWEKNRFIYDLMYVRKVMSRDLFDWLCREKIADGPLIAKWRKPGYEILCSMLAIQKGNHNFGTTSHCRVPLRLRAAQQRVTPDVQTGCISCASGDGRFGGPVWWNTPMDDADAEAEGAEANRSTWAPAGGGGGGGFGGGGQQQQQQQQQHGPPGGARKRPPADFEEDDELPDDVRARLEALKRGG